MKIGYARVSTDEQSLALQMDALEAEGCEHVYQDTASGARANRKGLADAVESCAAGDVLTVWKLDRLSRSVSDLVKLVETLKERNIGLKVLTGSGTAIDTTTAQGRFVFHVVAGMGEFERELIVERVTAGMKAARRRGQHLGRPRKLPPERLDVAAELLASGKSWRQVARALSVSTSTLRDGLKRRVVELQKRKPDRASPFTGSQTDIEGYLDERAS